MCLRWSGGPWVALFLESIDFTADEGLAWIQSSDIAERGFCNRCGSSLFWRLTAEGKYQGTTSVTLGALDGALATCGYVRIGEWRKRVTDSGKTRFFADAVTRLEALNS